MSGIGTGVRNIEPTGSPGLVHGGFNWGEYSSTSDFPNVSDDGLPLAVGDVASSDGFMYLCKGATSGSASWVLLIDAQAPSSYIAASIFVSTPVETTIATISTWTKVAGTTSLGTASTAQGFDMPADGRLRYTGALPIIIIAHGAVSMTAASNNQTTGWLFAKNGSPLMDTELQRRISTGSDIGSLSFHSMIDMDQNDYIEIYCQNITSTANLTANNMMLTCAGFPR